MNTYRVEIIETRTAFVEVKAKTKNEAIEKALHGEGDINRPYAPEIQSVIATIIEED